MICDRTEYADLRDLVRPLAMEWTRREAEREARERRARLAPAPVPPTTPPVSP